VKQFGDDGTADVASSGVLIQLEARWELWRREQHRARAVQRRAAALCIQARWGSRRAARMELRHRRAAFYSAVLRSLVQALRARREARRVCAERRWDRTRRYVRRLLEQCAATLIQGSWRRLVARRSLLRSLAASVRIQAAVRGYAGRLIAERRARERRVCRMVYSAAEPDWLCEAQVLVLTESDGVPAYSDLLGSIGYVGLCRLFAAPSGLHGKWLSQWIYDAILALLSVVGDGSEIRLAAKLRVDLLESES
jgi:hypothetical protein